MWEIAVDIVQIGLNIVTIGLILKLMHDKKD